MNTLIKLTAYSESESEGEGDGENEGDEEDQNLVKRLPLPDFFGNSVKTQSSKEVTKEGKVRNFPHEPGNWATYIYVPVDSLEFIGNLDSLVSYFEPLGLRVVEDFHISLTKTIILRHHWIPDFVSSIKKNLSGIKPFRIYLSGLKAYVNEARTRSFLSVKVTEGEEDLTLLVNNLSNCMKDYNLDGIYESTSFHVSLFWSPGDMSSKISKSIDMLPSSLNNFGFYKEVTHCVCATGNKIFSFNLY